MGSIPSGGSMVSLTPIENESLSCLISDDDRCVVQLDDSRPAE